MPPWVECTLSQIQSVTIQSSAFTVKQCWTSPIQLYFSFKNFSYRYLHRQNFRNIKQIKVELFCGSLRHPYSLSSESSKTKLEPLALFEVCPVILTQCGSDSQGAFGNVWGSLWLKEWWVGTCGSGRERGKPNILQRERYSLTSEDYHSPNAIIACSENAQSSICSPLFLHKSVHESLLTCLPHNALCSALL